MKDLCLVPPVVHRDRKCGGFRGGKGPIEIKDEKNSTSCGKSCLPTRAQAYFRPLPPSLASFARPPPLILFMNGVVGKCPGACEIESRNRIMFIYTVLWCSSGIIASWNLLGLGDDDCRKHC